MFYEKVLSTYSQIQGLRWVHNVDVPSGPNSSILLGGNVSTAVIRRGNVNTEYFVWGIHLSTDDALTFIRKDDSQPIIIKFVDCRQESPTKGNYFKLEVFPDTTKRLVIPRGVAHLPIQCNGLITLNTPTLYWDFGYRIRLAKLELDVINVEKDRPVDQFPLYQVSRFKVPNFLYPTVIKVFKNRYNPGYRAPFVFDRGGKLYVLRKKVQDLVDV